MFNPRKLIKKTSNQIIINESEIDLFDKPNYDYRDIKPFNYLKPYQDNLICYLDIETTGLTAWKDSVKMIGMKYSDGMYFYSYGHDEKKILSEFLMQLRSRAIYALITHNGFNFDLPFLQQRCRVHNLVFPFTIASKLRTITSASFHGKPITYFPIKYTNGNLHLIDTLVQVCIWDKTFNKLESYSLKNAVIGLGLRKERRKELTYQEMLDCYASNDWDNILEYLKYDLDDTELLADRIVKPYYYQLKWVPNVSFEYCCVASPALKMQKQYEKLVKGKTPIADDKLKFVGGISECINPGIYRKLCKVDVTSLYPSLIIEYGLCSRKDPEKLSVGLLKKLRSERVRLKNQPDLESQIEQEALKILINGGFYGMLGVGGYTFNDMEAAALVTAYGRAVLRLIERLGLSLGATVVELDTDGAYFDLEGLEVTPEALHETIQNGMPEGIGIELEIANACGYIPKAKNYIILYDKYNKKTQQVEEVLIKKGIYKKRNRIKFLNDFCINLVRSFTKSGKSSALEYFNNTIYQLNNKQIDIDQLFITRKISVAEKTLTNLGIGKPGDKVSYLYKSQDKVNKRTGKFLRKEYIPTINYDEYDPQYYINEISKFYYEIFPEDEVKPFNKKSLYVSV